MTVNLSVDYLDGARLGEWMQVTPRVLRASGSTGFVDALITADGRLVARSSAVFRLVPSGAATGRPPGPSRALELPSEPALSLSAPGRLAYC